MVKQVTQSFGFLKTTALGGAVFLLPLIVIGTLLGQLAQIVLVAVQVLNNALPIDSPQGWGLLVLFVIGVLLVACFFAGLVAQWTLGKRISAWLEKNLTLLFPRYVIVKATDGRQYRRRAREVGVETGAGQIRRSLANGLRSRTGAKRACNGLSTRAPDPWAGVVAYVDEDRVQPLPVEFSEALASLKDLDAARRG